MFRKNQLTRIAVLTGLLASSHALAAGAPAKMVITTSPQTVAAAGCSAVVQAQARDYYNSPATSTSAYAVFFSSSGSMAFYSDSGCTNAISQTTMAPGATTVSFYFKANSSGTQTITVSTFDLVDDYQDETITDIPSQGAPLYPEIFGVTLDNIQNTSAIVTSLKNLPHRPTARVVFDPGMSPSYYLPAVQQISGVADVMGEILDSINVPNFTVAQYQARTSSYISALKNYVSIWEIGNEINGEWLGATSSVIKKLTAAYNVAKSAGVKTELTLYYNAECYANPANEMLTWAAKNIPANMKTGLDYVLVSFYKDDCNNATPNWPVVFYQLGQIFPNAKIGFGEVGTSIASQKVDFINHFYGIRVQHPRYIGGYFWWYFFQDMVPWTNYLWSVLYNAMNH